MSPVTTTERPARRPLSLDDLERLQADARATLACEINRQFPGADAILARLAPAWRSVAGMLEQDGKTSYRPTCRIDLDPEHETLANIFDAAMRAIGDGRRAFRIEMPSGASPAQQ